MRFQAYLERSKYAPLEIELRHPHPPLLRSLTPHASRLAALTMWARDSSDFFQLAQHLQDPIPTLHKLGIMLCGLNVFQVPQGLNFLHTKEMELEGISPFQAPHSQVSPSRPGFLKFPTLTSLVVDTLPE